MHNKRLGRSWPVNVRFTSSGNNTIDITLPLHQNTMRSAMKFGLYSKTEFE